MVEFEDLIAAVERALSSVLIQDEEYGDIPDEYLDPLMASLMHEPVTLKTSGVTLDRSTITAHLLNDKTDPFNRKPLSVDDIEPSTSCLFLLACLSE